MRFLKKKKKKKKKSATSAERSKAARKAWITKRKRYGRSSSENKSIQHNINSKGSGKSKKLSKGKLSNKFKKIAKKYIKKR